MSEEMNSMACRILDFPADDPTGFCPFSGRVNMLDFIGLARIPFSGELVKRFSG